VNRGYGAALTTLCGRKLFLVKAWYYISSSVAMTQKKTSLVQLRQALDDLRQALEGVESALIEFEEQVLGEGGEHAAQRLPRGGRDFELLSIPDVCQQLGMGKSWVYRRLKSGQIPSIKLGHSIKVKHEDLEQYLESQRYQPPAEAV
jgi:excisionase family DNA binding protein